MFVTISQTALRPSAAIVVDDLAAMTFFVIATAAASLGISIATDSEGQKAVADFFYSCTDKVREKIEDYARGAGVTGCVIIHYNTEGWKVIVNAVYDYFVGSKTEGKYNYIESSLNNDNGLIGFSDSGTFSFTFSDDNPFTYTTVHLCDHSDLMLANNVKALDVCKNYPSLFPYSGSLDDEWYGTDVKIKVASFVKLTCLKDGFSHIRISCTGFSISPDATSENTRNVEFLSGVYTSEPSRSNPFSFRVKDEPWKTFDVGRPPSLGYGLSYGFVDTAGNSYDIIQNDSGKYIFQCAITDAVWYDGKEFDSIDDAINYFMSQCGLSVQGANAGAYVPGDTSKDRADSIPGVNVKDPADSKAKLDGVNALDTDDVDVYIPGTTEKLNDVVANPDAIVVDGADATTYPWIYDDAYDGDADLPLVDSSLWKTKFPFCIPFDIVNLFTRFESDPEVPNFHILMMPKNSFGFSNDDIYVDIDFSDYNTLVKIFRFFIALSFVVWLVLISRKVIGSE